MNPVEKIPPRLLAVLEALGIVKDDVQAKADEIAAAHPDLGLEALTFKLGDWIKTAIEPHLGLNAAVAFVTKMKNEIMSGEPGYDPSHGGVA